MVEHQGPGYLLLAAALGFAIVVNGQRAGNALVAASAVAVDRQGAAVHAGIGGCHSACHNGMDDVAGGVFHQDFARLQAVALQTFSGGSIVVFYSLIDELKLFNRCGGGVVVYQTCRQGELVGTILAFMHRSFGQRRGIPPVENDLVVQGDVNQTAFANISANADAIAAIVGNLNNLNNAVTEYSALQMLSDGIASKVAIGDVSSWLQQSHTGFYIKGSLIDIDATTRIGNNIISGDMIQANAITAPKIHVDSLSAISAVIGTLRTATSGARLEIVDSNLIRVYDGNGTLRVRMGVW